MIIPKKGNKTSWDDWLSKVEFNLTKEGYKKYVQDYKKSDYSYWKTFYSGNEKAYQVGVHIYDFRKFDPEQIISFQYECMLIGKDYVSMTVSKNIDLPEFEAMAVDFYNAIKLYENRI